MSQADSHKMVHIQNHPTGEEEWYCPECGRRFLMHWPPQYKRTILVPGDETVTHLGGKGEYGLELNMERAVTSLKSQDQSAGDDRVGSGDDEKYLAPWTNWLEAIDFKSLWDADNQ